MGEIVLAALIFVAVAGVVLLRGNRWRTFSLVAAALALGALGVDLLAQWLGPQAMGAGSISTIAPRDWLLPDPTLGYRPMADSKVRARETFDGKTVYDVSYTLLPDATRATAGAPAGSDTYLFLGDSFMFGVGLADDDTLPSQVAREADPRLHAVNFSAPGWGPNHWVRAIEGGLLDRYRGEPIKAVVVWIIPAHLARVSGDESWLGSSPRYALVQGVPHYTGTFNRYRLSHPVAGLRYLAAEQFSFVKALGESQRQQEQGELFTALMLRLRALAHEKLNAPLLVIYSWQDDVSWPDDNVSPTSHAPLVRWMDRLRDNGMPMLFADHETKGHDVDKLQIPHNGHPSVLANQLLAREVRRRLVDVPIE